MAAKAPRCFPRSNRPAPSQSLIATMDAYIPPLVVVLAASVAAPLIGELTSRWGLPVVVLELLLGVLIGPHGLQIAAPVNHVPTFALLGMAFLFFLAGFEIDLSAVRGKLRVVLGSWVLCFAMALGLGFAIHQAGLIDAWVAVAIAISTTAVGVLLPVLRDGGVLNTPLGQQALAIGAMGELAPILAMSLALSRTHTAPVQTAFTVAFIVAVVFMGRAMMRARTPRLLQVFRRMMTQSSLLPVRVAVLLLALMALLADALGLDIALGALAGGMILGLTFREDDAHVLREKLEAIGFGFLIPIFFVTSGMKLELGSLFESWGGIELLAAFVAAVLLARIPVVLIHLRSLGARQAAALGLFSATTLSLIVALTEVALANKIMAPAEAAPLVCAGIVTVVLFPALGVRLAKD
jgi:Kef-type K+ transport system membrane component KefB